MYQGTTPAITFNVLNADVSAMTPFVSFKYGSKVLTKTGSDVQMAYGDNKTTVVCCLTQEETLEIPKGTVKIQARFIDSNNQAYATNKAPIQVEDVIYREVIHYGG